ncbi:hypothetical protein BH23GEM1_BH23GEM1_01850 [soil metagenome]
MTLPGLMAIRLGLALTALLLFGLGIRRDAGYLRLAGIALLAAALVLRFVGRSTPRS